MLPSLRKKILLFSLRRLFGFSWQFCYGNAFSSKCSPRAMHIYKARLQHQYMHAAAALQIRAIGRHVIDTDDEL
jgi:hypothetical protein